MLVQDSKLSHLRNLIVLARVDEKEDPRELSFIDEVIKREELSESDYDFCKKNLESIADVVPQDYSERIEYLHDMIKLMMLDGHIDQREMDLCIECADMMKIPARNSQELVDSMISLIRKEIEN